MDDDGERAQQTTRRQMMDLLLRREQSARELSAALRIREKEVYDHLAHVRRSAVSQKKRLCVEPARCLECRYVFGDRRRLTTPGKCPRCKGEHIQDPRYRVVQWPPAAEEEQMP